MSERYSNWRIYQNERHSSYNHYCNHSYSLVHRNYTDGGELMPEEAEKKPQDLTFGSGPPIKKLKKLPDGTIRLLENVEHRQKKSDKEMNEEDPRA
jgi:hypothetical protein